VVSGSIITKILAGVAALVAGVVLLAGAATAGVTALLTPAGSGGVGTGMPAGSGRLEPASASASSIPAGYLALYQHAATGCPGLGWTVLAAIGTVESDNGQSAAPGVHSGANSAGAQGPMQFEPATFAAYARPVPAGGADPPSPYDPADAIYAAARYVCASGAAGGRDLPGAIYAYNHDPAYVTTVLALAAHYTQPNQPATPAATAVGYARSQLGVPYRWGGPAVGYARSQLGVPYRWGGDGNGGFDCSGLTQAAYSAAGVQLPRTAQQQYDAGPHLPTGTPLQPGDLLFYGTSPADITHVGIATDTHGTMADAPHTGAVVRTEPDWPDLIGATRPGT